MRWKRVAALFVVAVLNSGSAYGQDSSGAESNKVRDDRLRGAEVTQRTSNGVAVTAINTSGDLEPNVGLGCVPVTEVTSRVNPPALLYAATKCVRQEEYEKAWDLFTIGIDFSYYDTKRLADRSARGAGIALILKVMSGITKAQNERLRKIGAELQSDPKRSHDFCAEMTRIGAPTYEPLWAIRHGIGSYEEPRNGDFQANVDPKALWEEVRQRRCKVQSQGEAVPVPGGDRHGAEEAALEKASVREVLGDEKLRSYAVASGREKFSAWCAACHGFGGEGGRIAPSLTDAEWLWGGDVNAVSTSIRLGRRGQMPAGGGQRLSEEELTTLARAIVQARPLGTPLFFEKGCVACHGADGRGISAIGSPDLTNNIARFEQSVAGVTETIRYGVNDPSRPPGRYTVMPAFGSLLSETDIKRLTVFVLELARPTQVGGVPSYSHNGRQWYSRKLDCISPDEVSNTLAPPDLLSSVRECLVAGDDERAATLFAIAALYAQIDSGRFPDRTGRAPSALQFSEGLQPLPADGHERLKKASERLGKDPAYGERTCRTLMELGLPDYYPAYLVLRRISPYSKQPYDGVLEKGFDAPAAWKNLLSNLKCP